MTIQTETEEDCLPLMAELLVLAIATGRLAWALLPITSLESHSVPDIIISNL